MGIMENDPSTNASQFSISAALVASLLRVSSTPACNSPIVTDERKICSGRSVLIHATTAPWGVFLRNSKTMFVSSKYRITGNRTYSNSGPLKSTRGRLFHWPCFGTTSSNRGASPSSNSLMFGRRSRCNRRHSSAATSTASSTPRRVTTCGPFFNAASRNSLKRALASCNCHVLAPLFITAYYD